MYFKRALLLLVFFALAISAFAQNCPPNVGFESGNLNGWQCYVARMDRSGTFPIDWGNPIPDGVAGRHTILKNSSPQALDPIGQFPVNSPNGSNYSLMLGNAEVSGNNSVNGLYGYAERMTYEFTVPSDDYTMVYYYAVVLQNPGHTDSEQPKFAANLINLDNPGDVQCGAFAFTASSGLAGFVKVPGLVETYYKAWTPLTIKITGRKGKKYQLEFITRDCSRGGHFGYAYLDFNEDCSGSPITGNNYCDGASDKLTLTAPAGFQTYKWTDKDGKEVGNEPTLTLSPIPPLGTAFNLHIVPYPGLGCENDFSTTIQKVNEPFVLSVQSSIQNCLATGVDLTDPSIKAGSSSDMTYQYYTDPAGQNFLSDPKLVKVPGDYYIRGSNSFGCTDIAKISVLLYDGPVVDVTNPTPVCQPATVDITKAVRAAQDVTLTYYSDIALKNVVPNPAIITKSGTYYVQGVVQGIGCATVKPIIVVISPRPVITDKILPPGCPDLSLLTAATDGGDVSGNVSYLFFSDANGTIPYVNYNKINQSGTYYYKAVNQYGCESLGPPKKIVVTVYPVPIFKVTEPSPVIFPETVNLADTHPAIASATFSYWHDALCTIPLPDYKAIAYSGIFYIKATSLGGCVVTHPVTVLVNAPPEPDLIVGNTFTPNGDGINDEFKPTTKGVFILNYIKIINRYGKEVFVTKEILDRWNGTYKGTAAPVGTYFWIFSAYDLYRKKDYVKSGSVTIIR